MLKGLMNDMNLWEALSVVADLAEQTGYPGISKQLNALAHLSDETSQPSNVPRYVAAKSIRPGDRIHVPGGGIVTVNRAYADWHRVLKENALEWPEFANMHVMTLADGPQMHLPNDWLLLVEPSEHTRDAALEKALSDALVLDEGLNDNAYNEDDGFGWPGYRSS